MNTKGHYRESIKRIIPDEAFATEFKTAGRGLLICTHGHGGNCRS